MITRQRSMWLLLSGCASLLPALALLFLLRAPLQPHAAIILDGRADSGYGPALASDPDDLNSTIEGWIGTGWTEVISLYVTNDTRNLYVLVPLPAYSHTQSSGSYGLVIATGQYTATGGAAPTDPWGNAITFAYTATHANVGQAPTPLPYRTPTSARPPPRCPTASSPTSSCAATSWATTAAACTTTAGASCAAGTAATTRLAAASTGAG